jgi:hypothetical protein
VPKINRDKALKHPTQPPEDPGRTATAVEPVPFSSAAVLKSTVAAVNIKERMLSEEGAKGFGGQI